MRIHRAKQALLSKLPDEERFVLKVMANEMMQASGSRPKAGKATGDDRRRTGEKQASAVHTRRHPTGGSR